MALTNKETSLLEMAMRPSTNDGEALNAIRAFGRAVANRGGVASLFAGGVPTPVPTYVPYTEQKRQIDQLTAAVDERDQRITALQRDVERLARDNGVLSEQVRKLQAAATTKIKLSDDGSMGYDEFFNLVYRRLNSRDWQINFEHQTGLPRHRFATFRNSGRVPKEYVDAITRLKPVKKVPAYKDGWTKTEVERLRELTAEGKTEKVISDILTREFGRIITENRLKRVKLDSRNRTGVFKDPSYGPPIGTRRE